MEGNGGAIIWCTILGIYLERLRITAMNMSQDNRRPNSDWYRCTSVIVVINVKGRVAPY